MPNRISITSIDTGRRMIRGELEARHLLPVCTYATARQFFCTLYGCIPLGDILAALNGDSDMFQLWMLGFSLSLSEN